ncbi:MAG: oxidoreductase coenzyme F420-dependent [Thermoleophilia bacterium]|nr:oxidoreductase coenzyme F420-dependent [Thermoleophilia bacterium]
MKIGIIGAGHIGSALTRQLTKAGHEVEIANSRGPETLEALADETRAIPVRVEAIAHDKDLVVVTIPLKAVAYLPDGIFARSAPQMPVVDTCNYYPQRDGRIDEIEDTDLTESEWTARQLGRPVIKAFNNIYAQHLQEGGRRAGDVQRIALPVAGDDHDAKRVVMDLIDQIGFDAVDAGPLDESWRQQPGSPCYGEDLNVDALIEALAEASPVRPDGFRG